MSRTQSGPAAAPNSGCVPCSVSLLTGGQDPHYAYGLATALADESVEVEVVGSESEDSPAYHHAPALRFLALYGRRRSGGSWRRLGHILHVYAHLARYILLTPPRVFHILWNYRLPVIDRCLFMMLLRLRGHRIALTAHNVNAGRRDAQDSWRNRITLKIQYRLADRVFAHTERMKTELTSEFQVQPDRVTVIPYGINNAVPDTGRGQAEARRALGLDPAARVLLCFGAIKPYKGIEYLAEAFREIAASDPSVHLLLAGERKKGSEAYCDVVVQKLAAAPLAGRVTQRIGFIPDDQVELYFQAADVVVLPYTDIFESGILFLACSFGLPAVATDVGSFRDHIVEGETGFLCAPRDPAALATALQRYFASDLYRDLAARRPAIRHSMRARHSWSTVAAITCGAYPPTARAQGGR